MTAPDSAFLPGFLLGASLIIAIGAQNAFVLRQGLLRAHVWVVCLICALSDALLIAVGVAGLGTIIARNPVLVTAVTLGGAAFLAWYALRAAGRVFAPDHAMEAANGEVAPLARVLSTCLAFTFLNPHVYLDTVLLLGGLSAQYQDRARLAYGLGAISASFVWFFALGYGARLLQPLFRRPAAWRVLDALIALVMAALAVTLVLRLLDTR